MTGCLSAFLLPASCSCLPPPIASGRSGFRILVYDAREGLLAARADDALDLAPAVEEDERRDALDAETLRHGRVLVNVHLEEAHAARVLLRQRLERRCERAARRTPLRPEVQNHRH